MKRLHPPFRCGHPVLAGIFLLVFSGLLAASPSDESGLIPPTTDPALSPTEPDREGKVIVPEGYRLVWSDMSSTPKANGAPPRNSGPRNRDLRGIRKCSGTS